MAASTATGASAPRLVDFITPDGDRGFAIRRADGQFWAANRFRGFRLMGVNCRRVPPVLLAGDQRIRVRLLEESAA